MTRTSSASLQAFLDLSVKLASAVVNAQGDEARKVAAQAFADVFAPKDLSAEDLVYFTENLANDEEYVQGILRDLKQCSSGEGVESIAGDERSIATFTVIPPAGTIYEHETYEVVREVSFISKDGVEWTAEG